MNIIILNGPSSAGKTSIGKHIQEIMNDHYIMLGLDNIIYTMPEKINDYKADMQPRDGFHWMKGTDDEGNVLMHLTPGTYAQKIYDAMIGQVKFFADSGFNVIVDHVSLRNDYQMWVEALRDHQVLVCGVTAESKDLDERERQRGDRVLGGSRAQRLTVHTGYEYDVFINTSSTTTQEAAEKICQLNSTND